MPKLSGSPRYVLVVWQNDQIVGVTASESNSQDEFKRLKKYAKTLMADTDAHVRIYLVQEPEQLSQATLISDFQISKWKKELKKKLTKKTAPTTDSAQN